MMLEFFNELSEIQVYLIYLLAVVFILQLLQWLGVYSALTFYKKPEVVKNFSKGVSVIICAKNEKENIIQFLPSILNQNYCDFEVVVVNDASWDSTLEELEKLEKKYPNLKIVNNSLNERGQGKKMALTLGVKAATYEYFLLTDADCEPLSEYWIQSMVNQFQNKEIIIGYSPFKKGKGMINKISRFDSFTGGLNYLSLALRKSPYMGVGRNLAYTNKVFYNTSGFKSHYHILSGDDDLFINEAVNKNNYAVFLDKKDTVISDAKSSLKGYFWQKKRHFLTPNKYKIKHKIILTLLFINSVVFYTSIITSLFFDVIALVATIIFFIRYIIQIFLLIKPSKMMHARDLLWIYPILELVLLFLHPIFYLSNRFIKYNRWL